MRPQMGLAIKRTFQVLLGGLVCLVAIALPYAVRRRYCNLLAVLVHLPFIIFGRLARHLLAQLKLTPEDLLHG